MRQDEMISVTEAAKLAGVGLAMMYRWISTEVAAGNTSVFQPGISGSPRTAGRVRRDFVLRKHAERLRYAESKVNSLGGRVEWQGQFAGSSRKGAE